MKYLLCLLFFVGAFCVAFMGCDMDDDSDYGELTSTYESDDCTIKTYRKEDPVTNAVTITTVSYCFGKREVSELVIH